MFSRLSIFDDDSTDENEEEENKHPLDSASSIFNQIVNTIYHRLIHLI